MTQQKLRVFTKIFFYNDFGKALYIKTVRVFSMFPLFFNPRLHMLIGFRNTAI